MFRLLSNADRLQVPPLDASKLKRERLILVAELWWCNHLQKHFWVLGWETQISFSLWKIRVRDICHVKSLNFARVSTHECTFTMCGVLWSEEMTDNEQTYQIGWWYPNPKCIHTSYETICIYPKSKCIMYTIHHIISNHPALIESYTISNVNQTKIWMSRPRQVTTEKHSK